MFKRKLMHAALVSLLVVLTSPPANVVASFNGDPPSAEERAKARAERMPEGARKSATYDRSGRAVKIAYDACTGEEMQIEL